MKTFRFILYLVALISLAACWSCTTDEPGGGESGGGESVEQPGEAANRTVMVYMVADNSLGRGGYDRLDLKEMREAVDNGALGAKGRLLVYHNRTGTAQGNAPVLVDLRPGRCDTLKVYANDPTIYSTDAVRFGEALDDMKRYAPADSYGLVLWSHGTGWIEPSSSRSRSNGDEEIVPMQPTVSSFGDDRTQKMRVTTMAKVLEGRGLDFIYFDCCHMASIEVVYELRNVAAEIVASGTELHAEGMDYTINVPYFFAPGAPDMIGAAKATFNHYDSRESSDRTCTMTVVDTSRLDELARVSRRIMELAPGAPMTPAEYQSYMRKVESCYGTLSDMAHYYESLTGVSQELLAQWRAALDAAVKYSASTPWIFNVIKMNTYCGLGTYILSTPDDANHMGYRNQAWWTDVVSHNPAFAQ